MDELTIPGSRWWKVEFHAHTPKSDDYPDKAVSPEDWLLTHMRARFDAVVVTDHNSGEWVDTLKQAEKNLRIANHPDFRDLTVFPGVELAASGGIHVLLVLDPGKGGADVAGIIRACGYSGAWGDAAGRSTMSLDQMLPIATNHGALIIPAHVDRNNGLWLGPDFGSQVNALKQRELFALERMSMDSTPPPAMASVNKRISEIVGSDSHSLTEIGRAHTWIKMGTPSREGLRLALLDGSLSIRRHDQFIGNPNDRQPPQIIERLEINKAKYIGHVTPFVLSFSPWMTGIIGGRGTGKSSLLEFIRIALRREGELQEFETLHADFTSKYAAEWGGRIRGGLQTPDTEIRLVYRKNAQRYRINYSRNGSVTPIEEEDGNGGWQAATGEIQSRFPVRILSQKEIYAIAEDPSALLKVIDQDPRVDHSEWNMEWKRLSHEYRALMARIRELRSTRTELPRSKGQLEDVNRKLAILEKSGHQEILRAFQHARNQIRHLELWSSGLKTMPESIRALAESFSLADLDQTLFDPTADGDVLEEVKQATNILHEIATELVTLAERSESARVKWQAFLASSTFINRVAESHKAYEELVERFKAEGVQEIGEFSERIRERQTLEQRVVELEQKEKDLGALEGQRVELLKRIRAHRELLSNKRANFVSEALQGLNHVAIEVVRLGDYDSAVREYRRIIHREDDDRLTSDILDLENRSGILKDLYDADGRPAADISNCLEKVKKRSRAIAEGSQAEVEGLRGWFVKHLAGKVSPEDMDELDLFFPEDTLEMKYRSGVNESWRPIAQGSPGQKTAALLAFLLSYGEEPILLDQPEDDLDNLLIYTLVTRLIAERKPRRQIIVVTHNANIVVNGDAELVVALNSVNGQTAQTTGGLQEEEVRRIICDVMEGGREAFEMRYRRIKEGLDHV